jgi:membrane protein
MSEARKPDRRSGDRWNLAAALGLLAVAVLWDRIAPPEKTAQPKDDEAFSPKEDAERHASAADLATESGDRGRHATSPAEIPARGWKDILWRVYGNIGEHRILALAAGMTYYSLLAIFPAIAALVAIYGIFSDPGSIAKHLDDVSGFIPGGAVDVAREQLTRVATKGDRTLGFTFVIGLAISLWSANAAMKALFDTLNIVYGEEERRGFVKLNAISLGFTVGAIAFVIASLSAVVVIPVVLQYVGLSNAADLLIRIGRWPALFVAIAAALSGIYRFGPSRQAPRWTWITWGSAVATVLWLAASALFSWYAANFGTFNATYGSLGAVIGFMTWLWISAIVILVGAELNAEMEHQTARDTTTGKPKPLGARGAKMADTVGAARSEVPNRGRSCRSQEPSPWPSVGAG